MTGDVDGQVVVPRAMVWPPTVVAVIAGIALVGWVTGVQQLATVAPSWPAVTPSTAVGLFLGSVAVRPRVGTRDLRRVLVPGSAWLLIGLATATLLGLLVGRPDGLISSLLGALGWARFELVAGPSPATAVTMLMLGVAALMWRRAGSPRVLPHALALASGSLAYVALLGYGLGITSLYAPAGLPVGVGMSVLTAVGVLLLSATLLWRWVVHLRALSGSHRWQTRSMLLAALGVAAVLAAIVLVPRTATIGSTVAVLALAVVATSVFAALAHSWEQAAAAQARNLVADRMRSNFVTAVSHEIRTPLTIVTGLAELLATRSGELPVERAQELVGRLDHQAQRLSRLLLDLLDINLATRSSLTTERVPTQLADLIAGVVEERRSSGRPAELHLTPVMATIAPRLVSEAIRRLLDNVARHAPPGTRTRITLSTVGTRARITVEDDGPGIPPDELPYVFEPLRQRAAPLSHSPGAALGLASVRLCAHLHGGRASARASSLGGAAIDLELPLIADAPDSATHAWPAIPGHHSR